MADTTSREAYEAVLRTVDHHRPKMSDRGVLTVLAAHGKHDAEQVKTAMQAAVENGDLVRVGDAVVPAEEDALMAVIDREAARESPDNQTIARCNDALTEVRAA